MAAGRSRGHQSMAWFLLALLAVHEVHAVRESIDLHDAASVVSMANKEMSELEKHVSATKIASEFSINTHWASGAESSLRWRSSTITFKTVDGSGDSDPPKYLEVNGLDTKYRIMPDAVVMTKKVKGMATMQIVGWQVFANGQWGEISYDKSSALYIRTEMNPSVGVTERSMLNGRYAGYTLYKPPETGGKKTKPYYINDAGIQYVINNKDVTSPRIQQTRVAIQVPGKGPSDLNHADKDLMMLVDSMLGQTTCLGQPSKCALRCYYDPDRDMCGPTAFCNPVTSSDRLGNALAPFGQQQKCKAVGGDTPELADTALIQDGIENLKTMALQAAKNLQDADDVPRSKATQKTVQQTVHLFEAAADILNVIETLPGRFGEDTGNFPLAAARIGHTDMKHWRRRADRLTINQYRSAAAQPLESAGSAGVSVAAKLHSEMVKFLTKRPALIMESFKSDSKGKCVISDKTDSDKAQLQTVVKYYLSEPGYNRRDLDNPVNVPENCQEYLKGVATNTDVQDALETASDAEAVVDGRKTDGSSSLMEKLSDSLGGEDSLGELTNTDDTQSNLGSLLQTAEGAKVGEVFFIIACIFVCIICLLVAGAFFSGALSNMNSCMGGSDRPGDASCGGYFVCGVLGGLVIWGAFAMATPVGIVALVGAIIIAGASQSDFIELQAQAKSMDVRLNHYAHDEGLLKRQRNVREHLSDGLATLATWTTL